jgi:hypothetical protein
MDIGANARTLESPTPVSITSAGSNCHPDVVADLDGSPPGESLG